jgi:DNA-binding MarR family transcriptional regulator
MEKLSEAPLRRVFLAPSLEQLATLITEQGQTILREADISFSIRSASIVLLLTKNGPLTAADVAKTLRLPHQLVTQRIDALIDLKIVERASDAADARRKILKITPKGRVQLQRLKETLDLVEAAYARLFADIGCDLAARVLEVGEQLTRLPLPERVRAEKQARQEKPALRKQSR